MSSSFLECPECGAECNPTSRRCWLCEALLDQPAAGARGKRAPKNVVSDEPTSGVVLSVGMLVVMLFVIAGVLFKEAPGLGTLYVMVVTPALAAMSYKMWKQRGSGDAVSFGDMFVQFLSTAAMVFGALIVLSVTVVVATAVVCFVMCTTGAIR